ncbi:MAG: hypothetical protein ACXVJT_11080, partial [Thermoanaerobaculia bacterium]
LFFGAEFTQVYARSHGSMQAEGPKAKRPTEPRRPAALHPATAPTPEKAGGGTVNVLAGGAAGCLVGLFAGLIGGVIASFKTIWKILTF